MARARPSGGNRKAFRLPVAGELISLLPVVIFPSQAHFAHATVKNCGMLRQPTEAEGGTMRGHDWTK